MRPSAVRFRLVLAALAAALLLATVPCAWALSFSLSLDLPGLGPVDLALERTETGTHRLRLAPLKVNLPRLRATVSGTGDVRLEDFADLARLAELDIHDIRLSLNELQARKDGTSPWAALPDTEIRLELHHLNGALAFDNIRISCETLATATGSGQLEQGAASLDLAVRLEDVALLLSLAETFLATPLPPLATGGCTLNLALRGGDTTQLSLQLTPENLSLAGASVTGLRADVELPADAKAETTARLAATGLTYTSADGTFLAAKLAPELDLRFTPDGLLHAELTIESGELLAGPYYANLAERPLSLRVSGRPGNGVEVANLSAELTFARVARLALTGDWAYAAGRLRGRGRLDLGSDDLGASYTFLVREPYGLLKPALNALSASGAAALNLDLDAGSGLDLATFPDPATLLTALGARGRLSATDVALAHGETPVFSRLTLDAPIAPILPEHPGTLALTLHAPWGEVDVPPASLALSPGLVTLGVGSPLAVPLPQGGALTLANLRVVSPLAETRQATAQLRLTQTDLAALNLSPVPVSGSLDPTMLKLLLTRERIFLDGFLSGMLYGGRLRVQDLGVARPLAVDRTLSGSAWVEAMDLEPLSLALGVGRITGHVNMTLKDLAVSFGQPVSFDLRMASVAEDRTERVISLKAVNAISVMGTGSGLSGAGVGVFASLFKEFYYAALGMSCSLADDVFTVRGLIREDGVEYLVRRPALTGINVVNGNPNNRIGFADMQERFERVVNPQTGPRVDF